MIKQFSDPELGRFHKRKSTKHFSPFRRPNYSWLNFSSPWKWFYRAKLFFNSWLKLVYLWDVVHLAFALMLEFSNFDHKFIPQNRVNWIWNIAPSCARPSIFLIFFSWRSNVGIYTHIHWYIWTTAIENENIPLINRFLNVKHTINFACINSPGGGGIFSFSP